MLIGWLATQHGRQAEDDSGPGASFGEGWEYTKYPLTTKEPGRPGTGLSGNSRPDSGPAALDSLR